MSAVTFGPNDLLEYISEYCVLICRECKYAVQKNALKSHLLRHKIYRSERQQLLASLARLDILEPDDVALPCPVTRPVSSIPVLSGYCCTEQDCGHLTASSKRMKQHWSDTHGSGGHVPELSSFTRTVYMQTFFRGTKIKYFEVKVTTPELSEINDEGDMSEEHPNNHQVEHINNNRVTVAPSQPESSHSSPISVQVSSHDTKPFEMDLEIMTYFHQFVTATSFTLPEGRSSQLPREYWQKIVIPQALRRSWLMYGLLAISASHMVIQSDNAALKKLHLERRRSFVSRFSEGFEGLKDDCSLSHLDGSYQEVQHMGEHIRCLLYCVEFASYQVTLGHRPEEPCQLHVTLSNVKGCIASRSHASQEDLLLGMSDRNFGLVNTTSLSGFPDRLRGLPYRIAEVMEQPEDPQDIVTTLSALAFMLDCYNIDHEKGGVEAVWCGLALWLNQLSEHFHLLIIRHDPVALIILAHWAAGLVVPAERSGCWFLKGVGRTIMLQVKAHLSVESQAIQALLHGLPEDMIE